jgi:hypothetical protein
MSRLVSILGWWPRGVIVVVCEHGSDMWAHGTTGARPDRRLDRVGGCIVCMVCENAGVCPLVCTPELRVRACMRLAAAAGWRWGYAATRTQGTAMHARALA